MRANEGKEIMYVSLSYFKIPRNKWEKSLMAAWKAGCAELFHDVYKNSSFQTVPKPLLLHFVKH